jgi:spore coat polysaccharide biosynthesis predicted glycosyltransferase SpsG/CMP-N-acetylneuraminic acid synthetase
VPRKNLRLLAGKPLVTHTIDIALEKLPASHVVVITDDDEIAEIAQFRGVSVVRERQQADGKSTLDELMLRHIPDLITLGAKEADLLLTMQPTCPLVSAERIKEATAKFEAGAGSVITVKDDRHLRWKIKDGNPVPLYKKRINRQQMTPEYRESGAIIGARIEDILMNKTRIVEPVALIPLAEEESLDIDTFADLEVAEHWLTRKRILLFTGGSRELGMGHLYRTLALAQELARHDILIVTESSMTLGAEFFSTQVFQHRTISHRNELVALAPEFDLVVLDVLDTEAEFVGGLKEAGCAVVSFEDLGSGAEIADLVVSDIYPSPNAKNQLVGVQNAILAPSFETLNRRASIESGVGHVLVLFGGTDPSSLAQKSLRALEQIGYSGAVSCVRGFGSEDLEGEFDLDLQVLRNVKNMGSLMASADLALSSAGRTVTELMSIGVPTVCLAQNQKELSHTHASKENGILNLGLGSELSEEALAQELSAILIDFERRQQMSQTALAKIKGRSNQRVVNRILDLVSL